MSFKLVYYSQQDPQWKADLLGFGDPGDTIGTYGCALTSVAMLVSGHGYTETPKTLNQKLKNKNGFVSSGIRWDVVRQVHPEITLKENIPCENIDAPLGKINAALEAGQPVVVRVDSSPAPGLQWHYVMIYARKGTDDYLMLDPWPYSPGTDKQDSLMARYSRGNPLKRAIQQVLIYQCSTSGGPISLPSDETEDTTPSQPTTDSLGEGPRARVKAELTWGLNIRSSTDTTTTANIIISVAAGTELLLLDADGPSKIGTQQWVRVREPGGKQGFAAAWYLDLVSGGTPTPPTEPTPGPGNEAPAPTGSVQVRVTASSLRIRSSSNTSSDANIITSVPAGTILTLVNASEESKIGGNGQWVRVRTAQGQEGFTAAWYLEKVGGTQPTPEPPSDIHRTRPSIGEGLENVPMPPPANQRINQNSLLARIWNSYGGLLTAIASKMNFDAAIAVAILAQESGGQAYGADGRLLIRFENHLFHDFWGKQNISRYNDHFRTGSPRWTEHQWRPQASGAWRTCHTSQSEEWDVFSFARTLNDDAAKKSISMGLPQVLGSNYGVLGFASVDDMFNAFVASERNQVVAFFDFLQGNGSTATNALRNRDFRTIASIYNGAGNADYYGKLIKGHYDTFLKLRGSQAPAPSPEPPTPEPTPPMDPNKNYLVVSDAVGAAGTELRQKASESSPSQMHLTSGMLLIVIEPYSKAKSKLGKTGQWIYVRGPGTTKKLGYVLSQFVRLP